MSRIDRVLRTLFFGWLLGAAFVVAAAEITFYEYPGFGGQSLTLRGYTPNFGDIGFNDRAASIVVRSGSWQVCTDGEFKGNCVTLARGDYRVLDERFDGRISSAREVGSSGGDTGVYSRYGRGSVELFEEANFGGRSVVLDRDAVNFESIGFNDQAGSAIVRDGTWELCIGSEYRGTCRSYAVGRYADLGPGLTPDAARSERVVTIGANLQISQGIVVKADVQRFRENADLNRVNLGLGWSF